MATNTYLAIMDSSGSPSIVFFDGAEPLGASDYRVEGDTWTSNVAILRADEMGGRGPYAEVQEVIAGVMIGGSTVPNILANIATLRRLLEQAERWSKGEAVNSVEIRYSPKGATMSTAADPLRATILGSGQGFAPPSFSLPADFERQAGTAQTVTDIAVSFTRQGDWKADVETTAASSATTNGDLATITIAATSDPSPTRIKCNLYGIGSEDTLQFAESFIAVADGSSQIVVINAESGAPATDYTSVVDSATAARNTNVLRFTPSVTTERASALITHTITDNAKRVAVFAAIRNNSSSTNFRIRAELRSWLVSYTPELLIPPFVGAAKPSWHFLGLALNDSVGATKQIAFRAIASAAAGTLDIDSLVLVDVTNPSSYVIGILQTVFDVISGLEAPLDTDHRLLAEITPIVRGNDDKARVPYRGDLVLYTKGGTLTVLSMGVGSRATRDRWRQCSTGTTVLSQTWSAFRRTAYLTPQ